MGVHEANDTVSVEPANHQKGAAFPRTKSADEEPAKRVTPPPLATLVSNSYGGTGGGTPDFQRWRRRAFRAPRGPKAEPEPARISRDGLSEASFRSLRERDLKAFSDCGNAPERAVLSPRASSLRLRERRNALANIFEGKKTPEFVRVEFLETSQL